MRILISRLSALGDTVCTLPVAVALKKQFPECEITWVVDPRFEGIVECCIAVNNVVTCKPSFSLASLPRFEKPFDIVLDMQGLSKSALVVWRAKAPLKLGYHWQREIAPFFSRPVLPDPSSLHIVDQYLDRAARRFHRGDAPGDGRVISDVKPHPCGRTASAHNVAERRLGSPNDRNHDTRRNQ